MFVNMQLRNCHKCTCCQQVVHVLCAVVDKEDDTLICKLCYENREKEHILVQSVQETNKNNEISNLNTLPVQVVTDTSTRKIKNKRYPNETLEEREIRLKRRRYQEAKRREKIRNSETPYDTEQRRTQCRERQSKCRTKETINKRNNRLETDQESTAKRRQNETEEETALRRHTDRVSTALRYEKESKQYKVKRLLTV